MSRVVRLLPVLAAAGVAAQLLTGLLFAPLRWADLWALLGQGTALSVVAGLCGGFAAGTVLDRVHTLDANVAPANATRPLELLRRDSKATAVVAFCLAFATALVTWIAWSLNLDRTPPGAFLVAATTAGAVVGPGLFTAWPAFRAAHAWFLVRDQLPLRFGDFMTTAQTAGVLREEGITYHFRHAVLRAALQSAGSRGRRRELTAPPPFAQFFARRRRTSVVPAAASVTRAAPVAIFGVSISVMLPPSPPRVPLVGVVVPTVKVKVEGPPPGQAIVIVWEPARASLRMVAVPR